MHALAALGLKSTSRRPTLPAGAATAASQAIPAGRYTADIVVGVRWLPVTWKPDAAAQLTAVLSSLVGARNVSVVTGYDPERLRYTPPGMSRYTDERFPKVRVAFDLPTATVASTASGGLFRALARGIFNALAFTRTANVAAPTHGGDILDRMLDDRTIPLAAEGNGPPIFRATVNLTRTGNVATPGPAPVPGVASRNLTRAQIERFQRILRAIDPSNATYQAMAVDGTLGAPTRAAVTAFQTAYNAENARRSPQFQPPSLRVDGDLGPATQQALENYARLAPGVGTGTNLPATVPPSPLPVTPPVTPLTPPTTPPGTTPPTTSQDPRKGLATWQKAALAGSAAVAAGAVVWVLSAPGMPLAPATRQRSNPSRRKGKGRRR